MSRLAPLLLLATLTLGPATAPAQGSPSVSESSLAIIPRPRSLATHAGTFTVGPRTVIWTDAANAATGRMLARWLEQGTGLVLPVRVGGTPPTSNVIELRRDRALARVLGDEGYRLRVRPGRVVARAATDAGVFWAVQVMRQLLPPATLHAAPIGGVKATLPAVDVEDVPRFAWRGAHLDAVRHFMPKEFVRKYIDLLALHRMNVLHWHLTDDQGWRIEIRKYPRLTQVGGWRASSLVGAPHTDTTNNTYDGRPHGGFYTQDDVREIVAYAAARHVTVVPEIEMPGHARAAIAAYPELGVTGEAIPVWTNWGVTPYILNADERTVGFMQDVLAEVIALFPGRFVHVGGDEAPKDQWKASPRMQSRIRELGLKDEHELQGWFIHRMDAFLTAHGRRLVGWDEILEGGLAPGATVMSWRGTEGGIAAARAGHDVVMAPNRWTYLDQYQSADRAREPHAIGGFLPVDTVYAYDPIPRELDAAQARHVLGAQVQLWTEYVPDPKHAEYMIFPRLAAFAEVVWTTPSRKDLASFHERLARHLARLDALDVNYRRGP